MSPSPSSSKKKSLSSQKPATARLGRKSQDRSPVLFPDLQWETRFGYPQVAILGIDEVGRGCLAGPVVAGALILPSEVSWEHHPWVREINDSKCLGPEKREELAPKIESWATSFGVGVATVAEIDQINIFQASHLAMVRASQAALSRAKELGIAHKLSPLHAIVDGKFLPRGLPCPATAVIKGDLQCLSVAAASVLAKVWRDRYMIEQEARFPGYGFASHKGYSTPVHLAALKALGPCELHRQSFAPVAALLKRESAPPQEKQLSLYSEF